MEKKEYLIATITTIAIIMQAAIMYKQATISDEQNKNNRAALSAQVVVPSSFSLQPNNILIGITTKGPTAIHDITYFVDSQVIKPEDLAQELPEIKDKEFIRTTKKLEHLDELIDSVSYILPLSNSNLTTIITILRNNQTASLLVWGAIQYKDVFNDLKKKPFLALLKISPVFESGIRTNNILDSIILPTTPEQKNSLLKALSDGN